VALVTDTFVVFALSTTLATGLRTFLPEALAGALWITLSFVLTWGYHVYFEVRHEGRTPGKRVTGLRVVDGRGLPISVEQTFVRNVVRILDFIPVFYGLGALSCQLDRHRRRLGDIAADTLVVQDGRSFAQVAQLARSREFNSLRVPRVLRLMRHRISLEERELLLSLPLRAEELAAQARFDLMEQVGAHYRRVLEIDDPRLSGENLVKGLTALLFWERRAGPRAPGAGGKAAVPTA